MTFEELHKDCVAIYVKSLRIDYLKREIGMFIEPNYGYKDYLEGKRFGIKFFDCVKMSFTNVSMNMDGEYAEFISWIRRPVRLLEEIDMSEVRKLNNRPEKSKQYFKYNFMNAFEDDIEFIAGDCEI